MLITAKKIQELSFGALMKIYVEDCLERGRWLSPEETGDRQIAVGEQEFYQYLNEVFFRTPDAVYAVWEEKGCYVSALRLEPFRDGLLLEALATAPDQRGKGYARKLIQAVLDQTGPTRIYSHVDKRNSASLKTHAACGFSVILDYAVGIDGSVNPRSLTMCSQK